LRAVLFKSLKWKGKDPSEHPLLVFMTSKEKSETKGWLRRRLYVIPDDSSSSNLSTMENKLITLLNLILLGCYQSRVALLAHAWNKSETAVRRVLSEASALDQVFADDSSTEETVNVVEISPATPRNVDKTMSPSTAISSDGIMPVFEKANYQLAADNLSPTLIKDLRLDHAQEISDGKRRRPPSLRDYAETVESVLAQEFSNGKPSLLLITDARQTMKEQFKPAPIFFPKTKHVLVPLQNGRNCMLEFQRG